LAQWAKSGENHATYVKTMKEQNLSHDPFTANADQFAFADYCFLVHGPQSMNKVRTSHTCLAQSMSRISSDANTLWMPTDIVQARRLGWTGFVDTLESIFEMYQEMHTLGMVPRMKVSKARALI
jgi:hypothetical protein